MHFFLILLGGSHWECSQRSVRKPKTRMERSWREEIRHTGHSSNCAPSQHQCARHVTRPSLTLMLQPPHTEQHRLMPCGARISHFHKSLPKLHICEQNKWLLLFKATRFEGSLLCKIHNHCWQPTRPIMTRFPVILLTSVLHFSPLFSSDFRCQAFPQGPHACSYVCLEYFSPIYPHALLPRLLHLSSNMTLSTRTFSVALLFFIAFITNLYITYILLIWINHLSFPVRT